LETNVRRTLRAPVADNREKPFSAPKSLASAPKKQIPPEQTNAENFYYIKQMTAKTPMVILLKDGERLEGVIEWYDKGSIKVNREGAPNLLVFKSAIKYMYKAEDEV
jgi:sRNA-binding regulator protein Hfq